MKLKKNFDTLLMFSGGLDSTGALWQLIQEKKKFHIHHMNLKNVENRHQAETKSVESILNYIKQFGEFSYSESTHEYPVFNGSFMWDADLSSLMAGHICNSVRNIKYVAFGRTASDMSQTIGARVAKANKIFEAMCNGAQKIYPVQHLTKDQVYKMLPPDLVELTWSCRKPLYKPEGVHPCNKCITCNQMKKMGIKLQIQKCQNQLS